MHRSISRRDNTWNLFLAAALVGAVGAGLRAEDWPAYQKDAARSAATREQLALPLVQAWSHTAAQRPQPAWGEPGRTANMFDFDYAFQPVAAAGVLYFGSSADDTVYALNTADGSIRWTFTTGGPVRFAPQIADGRCYFASDDGKAYCLDAKTGELLWQFQAAPKNRMIAGNGRMISRWPCRSGVLVHGGVVYLTAGMWPAEGICYWALDAATGKPKWCNDTLNAFYLSYPHDGLAFGGPTPQGYLLTDGKSLVAPTGQSAPAVLDAASGELIHWRQQAPGSTWASLGDGFVMVAGRGWQPDQDIRLGEASLFHGDGIGFHGLRKDEPTGARKWAGYDQLPGSARYKKERWRGQISPIGGRDRAVLAGDRFYASGMDVVEAIDCGGDRLKRLWKIDFPRVYCLALAGDALWAGSDGKVTALSVADGRVLWQGEVAGQARGLAVAGGMLFVSTDTGRICAFSATPAALTASAAVQQDDPPRTGFALVVGGKDTELAERLATRARRNVICLLPDAAAVDAAHRRLLDRGYGRNIAVYPIPDGDQLPFADFFANEIAIEGPVGGIRPAEFYRVLHPCTGRLHFGSMTSEAISRFVQAAGIPAKEIQGNEVRRGPLEGAFDWNTKAVVDQRVKWPLELLWFGGPGRERTMARHRQGLPPPIPAHGRIFTPGDGYVTAVDAYNGFELWSRRASNYQHIAADDQYAYIGLGRRVMCCDAATGRLEKIFGRAEPVVLSLDKPKRFQASGKSRGNNGGAITVAATATEIQLTLEIDTPEPDGKDCWILWFDFREAAQRLLPHGKGRFPLIVSTASGTLRKFDGFLGAQVPKTALRRTDGGLVLSLPLEEIRRVAGAVPANFDLAAELILYRGFDVGFRSLPITAGRDPWQDGAATFVLGPAADAAASPLSQVATAEMDALPPHAQEWGRVPLHARHDGNVPRPALALQASPELGERLNPITGDTAARSYLRGYGCSGTISSVTMDFFRSGTFGMYDLADDSGMRNFAGVRPGCRITIAPALGVLVSAEGVGDCFCPYNFSTSMALAPAHQRSNEDWAVFVDKMRVAQTRRLALNLGAPGDRRDDSGTLWLAWPRQPMMFATGGSFGPRPHAFGLPVNIATFDDSRTVRVNADRVAIGGTNSPWIAASGIVGIKQLSLGLIYHEPRTTCLTLPAETRPKIDAQLDDAAWRGEPGVPVAVELKGASDKGRVRARYDAANLYLAYEQQPVIDRKGVRAPWSGAWFDVLLKDLSASRYAYFSVTADGARGGRSISSTVSVPRIEKVQIDGDPADWGEQGAVVDLGKEGGTIRLGWDDRGLLVLLDAAAGDDKQATGLRAQFANLESPAVVETVVDLARQTAEAIEAVIGGEGEKARSGKRSGKAAPAADIVDDPDPSRKELDQFRESQGVTTQIIAAKGGQRTRVEAVVPLDRLKLEPAEGSTIGLQVVRYDPAAHDRNITSGAGARRALFRSGGLLSLVLSKAKSGGPAVRAAGHRREFFGSAVTFAAAEREIPAAAWTASATADDRSFRVEAAIPLDVLAAAGLTRDRLLAQFHLPGKPTPNLDLLYQGFAMRSVRLHTAEAQLQPTGYSVRLHFAELEDKKPGERVFDIRLQGKIVAEAFDIAAAAGGPRQVTTRTFQISPAKELEIEFIPKAGMPLLSGVEVIAREAH